MDVLLRAGIFLISTVGLPGIHGAGVTGVHGSGVSTPSAALAAASTCGLAREVHIPKGKMFTIGRWSIMLAAHWPDVITPFFGNTANVPGPNPKLH